MVCVCFGQIDDKSAADGRAQERGRSSPRPLTIAELFDEDRLEVMSCRYADYDPARLASGGGDWLEEHPNPSLSPKAVSCASLFYSLFLFLSLSDVIFSFR